VVANLKQAGMTVAPDREIVALIAYLQRLGTDIKALPAPEAVPAAAPAAAPGATPAAPAAPAAPAPVTKTASAAAPVKGGL
jgi:hypothetical protein